MTFNSVTANTAWDQMDMERGGAAEPAPQDKMRALRGQVDEVKEQMKDNVERVIEGGEKGADLFTTAEGMEERLTETSEKVDRIYWWKKPKQVVLIVVILIVIILFIILVVVGIIPLSAHVTPAVTPTTKP
ncbi:Vesicle-associated membrane protein 8 [Liparis tanakae]|uniref:Vesicle-associated membrane protein 8 n=1 Tax=Liparis tanakae TaxID=230148 RepID=A0A4Z2IKE3_9TELE|nr:Vesicle-associated membrane protein 8 [Liparis tanakae]